MSDDKSFWPLRPDCGTLQVTKHYLLAVLVLLLVAAFALPLFYGHLQTAAAQESVSENESMFPMMRESGSFLESDWSFEGEDDFRAQIAGNNDPYIRVYPQFYWISGVNWPEGVEVYLKIYEDEDLVYDATTTSFDTDDEDGYFYFDLWDHDEPFELKSGQKVVVENEEVTLTHFVKDLVITEVNLTTDLVHGLADGPGSEVNVVHVGDYFAEKVVEAGPDRKWEADFSAEGGLDYKVTDRIWAFEFDEEGNATYYNWFPPLFTVDPTTDTIAVHRWPANTGLDVTVEDPEGPIWEGSIVTDANGDYWLSIGDEFDIDTGHIVTVTDGVATKAHVVTALRIHNVDWENNTISGVAEPGTDVEVVIYDHPYPVRIETADGDGNWTVDFSTAVGDEPWQSDYDIGPGNAGNANQRDAEGDETHIYWEVPNPFFFVDPYHNDIWGHEWPGDTELTVTIGDPGSPDWSEDVTTDGWGNFDLWEIDYDINAGNLVTVTDGADLTKDHVVTNLRDIEVDVETDIVSGWADSFSEVEVHIHHHGHYHIGRSTEADAQGYWEVDFSVPGSKPHEEVIYNIGPGSEGAALEPDEDGDETRINWRVERPFFMVDPYYNDIWGHEWPGDTELTVTIGDPGSPDWSEDVTTDRWGNFDLWEIGYDINAGNLVTVTDGADLTKDHLVTNLRDIEVDPEHDLVSGKADAGTEVEVHIHLEDYHIGRSVVTDGQGNWEANFSIPGSKPYEQETYNIKSGSQGSAQQRDDDGDETRIHWHLHSPFFHVDPQQSSVWGHHWGTGEQITVKIEQGGVELFSRTIDADVYGNFWLDLWYDFNILPGHEVTVTDNVNTLTHTVTELRIMEVDADSNIVAGTAAADTWVDVEIFVEEGEMAPRRLVKAEGGVWEADFSTKGHEDDCECYELLWDIKPNTHGAADQFEDHTSTRLHFQRAGRSITGQVTDTDGHPVAGVEIWADQKLNEHDWDWIGQTRTDQEGKYSLQGFVTGDYLVGTHFPGLTSEAVTITYPDQMVVDFILEPAGSISGQVTDIDGNPIKNAHVVAELFEEVPGEHWDEWHWKGSADTDQNGYYIIDTLPSGYYRLDADAEGYLTKTYDDTYVWDNYTLVGVTVGEDTGEIDFVLDRIDKRATINEAVNDGVAWMISEQNPDGSWGQENLITAKTALSLYVLNYHAMGTDQISLSSDYQYQAQAESALEYILKQAKFHYGSGMVYFSTPDNNYPIYKTSIALAAIVTTNRPDYVVDNFKNGEAWTLEQIAEGMVDYLKWAQIYDGGWSYGPVGRSDQSNAGWVTIGLGYAEDERFEFGIRISEIRSGLDDWITAIQVTAEGDPDDGGSLYTQLIEDAHMGANALRTGNLIQQMNLMGDIPGDERVQRALDYLARVWDEEHDSHDAWRGKPSNYHATYTIMKGLVAFGLDTIGEGIDWHGDFSEVIRAEQSEEGWWATSQHDRQEGGLLSTQWALMTLQKSTPFVIMRPNLAFTDVSIEPVFTSDWAGKYEVNFKVINLGNTALEEEVEIRLYIDGELKGTYQVSNLEPRETTDTFSYQGELEDTKSSADISMIIDEDNTVDELQKDNNIYPKTWPTNISGQIESRYYDDDLGDYVTRPLRGARVVALGENNEETAEAETDRKGYYELAGLEEGTYTVRASKPFHQAGELPGVVVEHPYATGDRNLILDFTGHSFFVVNPVDNYIWGHQWPANAALTVTIEDPEGLQWERHPTVDAEGNFGLFGELQDVDIDTGYKVTVTDEITVKEHTVTALGNVTVDMNKNQVSGTAEPGSQVRVYIYDEAENDPRRYVTADPDGNWVADFSEGTGPEPWQRAYNIEYGTEGNANQHDEDGDATHIPWRSETGAEIDAVILEKEAGVSYVEAELNRWAEAFFTGSPDPLYAYVGGGPIVGIRSGVKYIDLVSYSDMYFIHGGDLQQAINDAEPLDQDIYDKIEYYDEP